MITGVVDDVDRTDDCDSSSPVVSDTLNISGDDDSEEDMLLELLVELFVELLVVLLLPLVMLREPALVVLREPLPMMRCRDIYIVLYVEREMIVYLNHLG